MQIQVNGTDYGPTQDITGDPANAGYCVTATTAAGEVYIHNRIDLSEADAKHLCKMIGTAGKITLEHWQFWRTVYGSAAFQEEEAEAAQAADMIRRGAASEGDFAGTPVGAML